MSKYGPWVWILFFGSAWGMNELWAGSAVFKSLGLFGSMWLAFFAVFLLAASRAVTPRFGACLLAGGVAVAFKSLHTEPFFCHLLGIALLALSFEGTAALCFLREGSTRPLIRAGSAGLLGVYLSRIAFVLIVTYIVGNGAWTAPDSTKTFHHLVRTGLPAALGGALAAPLGFWIGGHVRTLSLERPALAFGGAAVFSLLLWALGALPIG
jgi:hypothetical protein